jgi:para-aminobenzoate synthetase
VRYHSLAAARVPQELGKIAWTDDGVLMGVRHQSAPTWGVQFHPESIRSEHSRTLLANFRDLTVMGRAPADDVAPVVHISSRPTAVQSRYRVLVRKLEVLPDTTAAYKALLPQRRGASGSPAAQCSKAFFGSPLWEMTQAPLAEYVTYDVCRGVVIVRHSDNHMNVFHSSFFDYLNGQLRQRSVTVPEGLPFEFNLGYVGYLRYELKVESGGHPAHHATTPDAALLFADRIVGFDHREQTSYLLCLVLNETDPTAARWLDDTAAQLRALPDVSPAAQTSNSVLLRSVDVEIEKHVEFDMIKRRTLNESTLASRKFKMENRTRFVLPTSPPLEFQPIRSRPTSHCAGSAQCLTARS